MAWRSIHQWFSSVAAMNGDRIALEWQDIHVSYGELEYRSDSIACRLLACRSAKGTRVGVLLARRLDVIVALLGTLKAGHVFMPLDPSLPDARLLRMIVIGSIDILLIDSSTKTVADRLLSGAEKDSQPATVDLEEATLRRALNCPPADAAPDDPAYLYFTSGSTGQPKAILGRLKGIDHFVAWELEMLPVPAGVRVSQLTPPGFDPFLRDVFVPLCSGGTLCLPEDPLILTIPPRLISWLGAARVQLVHCVPSLFRAMLGTRLDERQMSALKYVLLAGERLLPIDIEQWMRIFGQRVELINLYGPTETTLAKLFHRITARDIQRGCIPIGRPIPDTSVCIMDEAGNLCPPGAVGELLISTPYASLGYFRDLEQTRRAFVPKPTRGVSDVAYRTGDIVRMLSDGAIEFVGRRDDQVKIHGIRVEPAEIEQALRLHPTVRDVAVIAQKAEGDEVRLVAFVVGGDSNTRALREYLAELLPTHMIPSGFMFLNELPRTVNGKLDRQHLATGGSLENLNTSA